MLNVEGKKIGAVSYEGKKISKIYSEGKLVFNSYKEPIYDGNYMDLIIHIDQTSGDYNLINLRNVIDLSSNDDEVKVKVDWGDGLLDVPTEYTLKRNNNEPIQNRYNIGKHRIRIMCDDGIHWVGGNEWYNYNLQNCLIEIQIPQGKSPIKEVGDEGNSDGGLFYNFSYLEYVSDEFFARLTNLKHLTFSFYNCDSLRRIPDIKGLTLLEDVGHCFNGCGSILEIPTDLFKNCINLKYAGSCFNRCFSLESIPEDIFKYNNQLTDVSYCFCFDGQVSGKLPELWKTHPSIIYYEACFRYCSGASNYAEAQNNGWT